MPANVGSMAYVGKEPWHGLGQRVESVVHAEQMLKAAGLDWTVEKRPAPGARSLRKTLYGDDRFSRYEIIRLPRPKTDEKEVVLGIVTDRYTPLQNREAFEFFDPIVDQKMAFFETAGVLGDGERVWVMAKMPEVIEVVRGDECQKYLLLSNSHTGQGSVLVKYTAIRVVCQNTLILALQDGQPAFRVRHSKIMTDRLRAISELIAIAIDVFTQAHEVFKRMASTDLGNGLLERYLEVVFPQTPAQKKKGAEPPKRQHVLHTLETTDNLQGRGVRGTLWAAYNAVTQFEDYRQSTRESPEKRLDRVWFGDGAKLKVQAFQAAKELALSV